MTQLYLSSVGDENIESHILITCDLFVAQSTQTQAEGIEAHLSDAENMAGQILGYYESLESASKALTKHSDLNDKLPVNVLLVFLYAAVREHEFLGAILDELFSLYGDASTGAQMQVLNGLNTQGMSFTEIMSIKGFMYDGRFSSVPRPKMFDAAGNLRHQPAAFALVHEVEFIHEMSAIFKQGTWGISRVLAQYPAMDESGRKKIDKELARRVYGSKLAPDDPVRDLLSDKLDDVEEAKVRIANMFSGTALRSDSNPDGSDCFVTYLEQAFEHMECMPKERALKALDEFNRTITSWLSHMSGRLNNCHEPVKCIGMIIERSKVFGYDALEALIPILDQKSIQNKEDALSYLLRKVDLESDSWHQSDVMKKALLLSADDEVLLKLNLEEVKLARLADLKGSDVLRQALLSTDRGRDVVFGQDLGL